MVSAAYFSVAGIVLVLIVLQQIVVGRLNWYKILGLSSGDISEDTLVTMIHILVIGVCIRFFTVLICHILYALQKAVLPGFINLMSSALIMLYLVCSKPTGSESDIITLAYINTIANNVPALIATVWIFATILRGMWPRFRAFTWNATQEVLGTGGALFYLQIIIMVLFNVKELYISWFVGAEAVVDYQIYYKLIGMIGGIILTGAESGMVRSNEGTCGKKGTMDSGFVSKGNGADCVIWRSTACFGRSNADGC